VYNSNGKRGATIQQDIFQPQNKYQVTTRNGKTGTIKKDILKREIRSILSLQQPTLRTHSPSNRQSQILRIHKDAFHPIIKFKLRMALRAFHLSALGFKDFGTEWAFDETFRLRIHFAGGCKSPPNLFRSLSWRPQRDFSPQGIGR
jgi:hypothetical protein